MFTMSKGTSVLCVFADGKHDALLDSECFLVFCLQVPAFIALASFLGEGHLSNQSQLLMPTVQKKPT